MATVADAEEAGVASAWEYCDTVALDSQGVIQRIRDLMDHPPRPWIEEKLVRLMEKRSQEPDAGARSQQRSGKRGVGQKDETGSGDGEIDHMHDIATPAGIRQA